MYATVDDLKKRLPNHFEGLYADEEGAADESLMAEDLAAANAEINALLAVRYAVPVTDSDSLPLLKSFCLTLAEELAFTRNSANELPEQVVKRAANVRKQLVKVESGKFILPGSPAESSRGSNVSIVDGPAGVFGRDKMEGF